MTPCLVERLESRTLLTQTALIPMVDGQVSDRDANGTFETIDATSTTVTNRWFTFATTPSIGREYPIFEFDLSNIAAVGTAKLGFTVGSFTYSTLNGVTSYAKFNIAAYGGQSGMTSADGTASAVSLGSATVTSTGYQEVSLNATALAGLARQRIHIRLENTTENGDWVQISTLEDPFRTPPTLTITDLAVPTINVTARNFTYFGQYYSTIATATGAGGVAVPGTMTNTYYTGPTASGLGTTAPPIDAGTYTVVASFVSADPAYSNAVSAPVTYTIAKARPRVTATAPNDVFTGQPHPATAVAVGVAGGDLNGSFTFQYFTGNSVNGVGSTVAPTNLGTYTVVANFTSADPNHLDGQSSPVTFTIDRTTRLKAIVDGQVIDRNLDGVFETVDSTPYTYTVSNRWAPSSTGRALPIFEFDLSNIPAGAKIVSAKIGLSVNSYTSNTSANVQFFSYGEADGVISTSDATRSGTLLGSSTVNSLGYQEFSLDGLGLTSFVGQKAGIRLENPNYNLGYLSLATLNNSLSAPPTLLLNLVLPPSVIAVNPGGMYTGESFPATATTTGVGGEAVSGTTTFTYYNGATVNGTGFTSAPINPGTYTVVASFVSSDSAYLNALSTPVTFTINTIAPTVVAQAAGGIFNGQPFVARSTVNGIGGGTVSGTSTFTYFNGTTANGTGSTSAPSNAGTYTVVAAFTSSDPRYGNAQSAPVTFTISQAIPTVVAKNTGGIYTGQPYAAAATAKGVNGVTVSGSNVFTYYVGASASGTSSWTAPVNAGTYTVVATFTSNDPNYGNSQSSPVTFIIGKAIPTVVASDAGGPFSGRAFPATAIAKGVGGTTVTGSMTFTYYAGTTATGTGSAFAPVNVGSYTVIASFTSGNPNYENGRSNPVTFKIVPAPATRLAFLQPPISGVAGQALSPAVKVAVQDQFGQVVAGNSSSVTLTLVGGTFSNGFTFTKSPAVNGIATFSNLVINATGTYTLTVSSGTLSGATSQSFVVAPAAAKKLIFVQPPVSGIAGQYLSPAVKVAVADQFGNIVTSNNASVTLTLTTGKFSNGYTFTKSPAVNGVATFSGLQWNVAGTYAVTVSSGTLAAATSKSFVVAPAAATRLIIQQQPTTGTAGRVLSPALKVAVTDRFGNIVTSNNSTVTLALTTGKFSNGSTTATATAINGVATFNGLTVNVAGNYLLRATGGSLASVSSTSISIVAASAAKLAFMQSPLSGTVGQALSPAVRVAIQDAFGNLVTSNSSSVTLTLNTGTFQTGGSTVTVQAVNGVATFSTLKISLRGTYTLTARIGSLTASTSAAFSIR